MRWGTAFTLAHCMPCSRGRGASRCALPPHPSLRLSPVLCAAPAALLAILSALKLFRSPDDDDDDDDNAAADGKADTKSSTPKHLHRRASSASRSRPVPVRGKPTVPMSAFAVLATTFTMTFVAEWGDRSQIATIAMGAAKDPLGVCVGGLIGHALCTGLAVLGGKLLATRISERAVLIVGGVLFLAFAVHSLWGGPDA